MSDTKPKRGIKRNISVPVGIEKILYLASRDDVFRARLLDDREVALSSSGITLKTSERMMLSFMDASELSTMIDNLKPPKPHRRKFMNAVAATFVTISAGSLLQACDSDSGKVDVKEDFVYATNGINPDTVTIEETGVETKGITPEVVDIEEDFNHSETGVMPDTVDITEDYLQPAGITPDVIEVAEEFKHADTGVMPDVVDVEQDFPAAGTGILPDVE